MIVTIRQASSILRFITDSLLQLLLKDNRARFSLQNSNLAMSPVLNPMTVELVHNSALVFRLQRRGLPGADRSFRHGSQCPCNELFALADRRDVVERRFRRGIVEQRTDH